MAGLNVSFGAPCTYLFAYIESFKYIIKRQGVRTMSFAIGVERARAAKPRQKKRGPIFGSTRTTLKKF